MSTSVSGVGRTEAIGVSLPASIPGSTPEPSVSALSSQLEQLTAVVSEIRSSLDFPDRRPIDSFAAVRPPPAPPFSFPLTAPASMTMPYFTYTPSSVVATPYSSQLLPQTLVTQHTVSPLSASATPYSLPPYGFPDASSMVAPPIRVPQPSPQLWQPDHADPRSLDRMPLRRPQMVNPSSCWGPPNQRPQFGAQPPEQ